MPLDQSAKQLQASLSVPPVPGGVNCLKTLTDLAAWLAGSTVVVKFGQLFGYTSGIPSSAPPESRSMPRFLYDNADRFVGLAVWVPSLGAWSVGGVIGEMKIIKRTAITVPQDMLDKCLSGWHVCDGSTTGVPDLTARMTGGDQKLVDPSNTLNADVRFNAQIPTPLFAGVGPVWDIYTIMYNGLP